MDAEAAFRHCHWKPRTPTVHQEFLSKLFSYWTEPDTSAAMDVG